MGTAADDDGQLVLSGANGPESLPGPIELPEIKVPTEKLRAHLKALWDGIDENSYEIEWMVSIHNQRKTFTLDNLIPLLEKIHAEITAKLSGDFSSKIDAAASKGVGPIVPIFSDHPYGPVDEHLAKIREIGGVQNL